MDALLNPLGDFISRHHAWAGAVLGVITFVESLVFIGAFVPATALMVIAGGLVAAGVLDPASVLLWCVAGAVMGDAVSYQLGRRWGPSALRRSEFKPHRRVIARTRLFFRRYGPISIFIGRFFGPLRAFIPLVAGMMLMKSRRFQIANVVSAILWVPIMLAPGYFAALGLARLEALGEADMLTLLIVGGLVTAVAVVVGWRIIARRMARTNLPLRAARGRA